MSAPFDWSPFKPVSDPSSKNFTFATAKGMEQFGCCPKTAGNRSRRVLFGWLNNGWNQGGSKAAPPLPNNTLTLPRELTATARGQLRQRFVPELQRLRRAHVSSARDYRETTALWFISGRHWVERGG
jgi:sucrose-6-phosphate hydrolase SacC (GH32 family)